MPRTQRTIRLARANPAVTTTREPGEEEAEAALDWWGFESSRVYEAAYAADRHQLFVRFMRPTEGQVEYVYDGVQPSEWRNFRRSQSPGKYINRVLNYKNYHQTR